MVVNSPIRSAVLGALLLCALAGPAAGDVVVIDGVIPDPFSPNGDGVFDGTALYYTLSEAASVTVTVTGAGVGPDILRQAQENAGTHTLWWYGKSDGLQVPDGEYTFTVAAEPLSPPAEPEQVEATVVVDTEAPDPGLYTVTPGRFSPDGDGVADSVHVSLVIDPSEPTNEVTVAVTGSDGSVVRWLYSSIGAVDASFYWDGRDEDGSLVEDGLYRVRFGIRDAAGNEAVAFELVDLDTEPPVLSADYPDPEVAEFRFASATGAISGTAEDRAGVVAVEYSFDQEVWYPAALAGSDSVSWTAAVACDTCLADPSNPTDEYGEVHVRAYDGTPTADGHGHVNSSSSTNPILTFDLAFDVAGPIHETSDLMGDEGPFSPGQTITVSTRWDAAGYDVSADFSAVLMPADSLLYDPDDVDVEDKPGGLYEVEYTLPQGMSIPDGARPVAVTARDSLTTPSGPVVRTVTDTTVYVTVVMASDEPSGFSVDRNSFNPALGEQVTVGFGTAQGRARISVFNMAGTLVRSIDDAGVESLTWDGANDEGETVASGVYFLWIRTDDIEATRKVAVVK
jgi:flagellar hook assembly protein FlgD